MKVTQLRLAGQGARSELLVERFSPELNVFFGHPQSGKSTVAKLAAHLLFGKTEITSPREQGSGNSHLAEGSVEVENRQGRYLLRRHRDGTPQGRLSIAAAGGPAVDSGTIRSLLGGASPRLAAKLYSVDFAREPRAESLLEGEFAREFALTLAPAVDGETALVCRAHAAPGPSGIDRRRVDELVRRRDEVVGQVEQCLSAHRRDSCNLQQELHDVDGLLGKRREEAEQLESKLRAADSRLAEIDARLRYFSLESAVRRSPEADDQMQRERMEELDAEIARCRQTLADLQTRDAAVRRELAEIHPDGTADSVSSLGDQRATVGVLERLLDDLDAEVSQLARSHEPGRCVGCDGHARLSPVAQMLRQQLYALCGQVTEQERAVRRNQLRAESRQLARAQTDLSERLEHLLERRQAIVHEVQRIRRPVVLLPEPPALPHCQCCGHGEFVRGADAMVLARSNRQRDEETTRLGRIEQERLRNELRSTSDSLQQEIAALEARWNVLQRNRVQGTAGAPLDDLRSEVERLESEIQRELSGGAAVSARGEAGPLHRQPWKASDALAQLTDGRLVQIRMSREGRDASIIDRAGSTLSLAELNPAERDQLYVALTLALVSSLGNRGIDLPLFLDEPFLRQDSRDVAAMAGVLGEFARQGRQVVVFTENLDAARRFESLGVAVGNLDLIRRSASLAAPTIVQAEATPAEDGAPATVRIVRETLNDHKPQLRVAGEWSSDDEEQEQFFLTLGAPIGDFPVLGSETTKAFARLGIAVVDDLLAADASAVAANLRRPSVNAEAVRLWQTHMGLMCFVPGVSLNDAQVLAANEITSPEALFTIDVRLLADSIGRFLATDRGRRLTSIGARFSRDRLAELQKLARGQREAWQLARPRFSWVDRPLPAPIRAGGRAARPEPERSVHAKPRRAHRELRFLLARTSPILDAPSIGPIAAERLVKVGVRTVADLLNANPQSIAAEIGASRLTPEVISRWQSEARLACRVPELRSCSAQLLVASGFTEPEQIAGAKPAELIAKVRAVCRSPKGRRLLRDGKAPSRNRIAQWVRYAAHMRPLEAA